MTDIRPFAGSPAPNTSPTVADAGGGIGTGAQQPAVATPSATEIAQLLGDMSRMAASLRAGSSLGQGASGVTDANGAPAIDGVRIDFSPEDMAAALLVLQGKTQEAQLSTAKEGLVTNKKKLEEKNQQAMNKINEWIQKCQDAAAKQKSSGIFGWVSKIAGFVAAALALTVAVVATGGVAAPVVALALVGMIGASISLASHISQEAGGPPLDLSGQMAKLSTAVLLACGVPEDKAGPAGRMMSGMAGLMQGAVLVDPNFAGQAFGGFAELVGANADQTAIVAGVMTAFATIAITVAMIAASGGSKLDSAVDGMAKTVVTAGKIGQGVAGIASGAATVTTGGLNIAKAADERAASEAQADKKLIDSIIAKLQQQMENDREDVKKVMQEMMDGVTLVSQMINAAGQSRAQIAAQMTGRGQSI